MWLEVVTRHYQTPRRAALLHRQMASLARLPGGAWTQTVLIDPHGHGIVASHVRLRTYEPGGDRVWVLDDDDLCAAPALLDWVDPTCDLQIFKIFHASSGTLPHPPHWTGPITVGQIGACSVIVRKDLWMRARHAWGARYEGDYDFVHACHALATQVVWTDRVIATILEVNRGAA